MTSAEHTSGIRSQIKCVLDFLRAVGSVCGSSDLFRALVQKRHSHGEYHETLLVRRSWVENGCESMEVIGLESCILQISS